MQLLKTKTISEIKILLDWQIKHCRIKTSVNLKTQQLNQINMKQGKKWNTIKISSLTCILNTLTDI